MAEPDMLASQQKNWSAKPLFVHSIIFLDQTVKCLSTRSHSACLLV